MGDRSETLHALVEVSVVELNRGIRNLYALELVRLVLQFFFLTLEVLQLISDFRSRNLLALEAFEFLRRLGHGVLAKGNQTHMFFEVLLFLIDPGQFNDEGVIVLLLQLRLLHLQLLYQFLELLVDLAHVADLLLLHLLRQVEALFQQLLRLCAQRV